MYLCRENGNADLPRRQDGRGASTTSGRIADRHRASPVYADGKIYLTARDGIVTVVKAGRKFEILAKNDLGESISASPRSPSGRIYLRTFDALYAIKK